MQEMLEIQVLSLGREDPLEGDMGVYWRESTPVFLPGESHGQNPYGPWDHIQSDTTEAI